MRDWWHSTFLGKTIRQDRWLGLSFAAFALIQCGAQLFTAEVTPFFLYGMYSDKLHPAAEYVRVTCQVNGEPLTQEEMPRYAGELFFSTLHRLEELDAMAYEDLFAPFITERFSWLPDESERLLSEELSFAPEDTAALGQWMIRYLGRTLDRPVRTVTIQRERYTYEADRPVLLDRSPLLTAYVLPPEH